MFVVAACAGEDGDSLDAITAENENQAAGFSGEFGARLEVVERSDDFGDVARPFVFFIVSEKARGAIAKVGDLVTNGLEFFDEPCGAKSSRGFFSAGRESGSAGGRADESNLVRLTDDFDRLGTLLLNR